MLELVIPTLEDMWFREKLLADEKKRWHIIMLGEEPYHFQRKNGSRGISAGLLIMRILDTIGI